MTDDAIYFNFSARVVGKINEEIWRPSKVQNSQFENLKMYSSRELDIRYVQLDSIESWKIEFSNREVKRFPTLS